jgi:hypothetical protein
MMSLEGGTSSSLLVTRYLVTVFLALTLLLILDRHAHLIKAFKPCVFLKHHYS